MDVILEEGIIEINDYYVFPPSKLIEHIVRSCHCRRDILDEIVDGTVVDEKSTVILCQHVFGDISSVPFAFKEGWTYGLCADVVLLRDLEHTLVGKVITNLLH